MPYPHEVTLAKANTAVRESNFPTAALLFYQATVEGSLEAQKVFEGESSARFQTNPHSHLEIKADDETAADVWPMALQYLMGLGVVRNDQRAFELLNQWAEENAERDFSSESAEEKTARAKLCNLLGYLYSNGRGIAQDYRKAHKYYEEAANCGHAVAMYNLGWLYQKGHGVAQDYRKAHKYYEEAANSGYAGAMYNLGHLYQKGHGVAQDYRKAHKYYEEAANSGCAGAMNNLGWLYAEGLGVAQDYAKAHEYYENAANCGHTTAMFNLGWLYWEGCVPGGACVRNQLRALYWFNQYNKHEPNGEEHVDLTQACNDRMRGKSRAFALALLTENSPSKDDNSSLEDAIKAILLDENEDEKNKTAVVEQLREEITKGKWSFASPAVQATLTGLFNPGDQGSLFHFVLNGKQHSELLMALIVQRHRDHHFLSQAIFADAETETKRESTSEGSSTVVSDEELLKAAALTPTRDFILVDNHLYNKVMCVVLSLLEFPKNDQDENIDRYSLFLPFIQNLVVLQSCLDENNKNLLVGRVLAYINLEKNFHRMPDSDIDSYFKSEDYSALHRKVLAKVEKAINPGLDAEEKEEDLSKTAMKGIINQSNNNRQQDKAAALEGWLKTLHELRQAIRQESYRVMFNYALIQSLNFRVTYKVPRDIAAIDRCLKTMIDGQYKYNNRQHHYQRPDDVKKAFNEMQAITTAHLTERQTACLGFFKSTRATVIYNLAFRISLLSRLFDSSASNNVEPDFSTENNTGESSSLLNGNSDSDRYELELSLI